MHATSTIEMPPNYSKSFFDSTKKRRRHKDENKQKLDHRMQHGQSASASSWGAADISESDSSTSSNSDSDFDKFEEDEETSTAKISSHPPPKKRRHLGSEDVGRFASMSIERDGIPLSFDHRIHPSEILVPQSPKLQPQPKSSEDVQNVSKDNIGENNFSLEEVKPSLIEEPLDDETEMRNRRGPNTFQLDNDRFFVTSLSDSSSDEEDELEEQERERIETIIQNADSEQLKEALEANSNTQSFTINGELISKLQALEWQRRLCIGREKAATPLFKPLPKDNEVKKNDEESALVLWRQPHNLSLEFGKTNFPCTDKVTSLPIPQIQSSPPVVREDGQYAYVHRTSEARKQNVDAMDVD